MVADPYDIVLGKVARLEPPDMDDIIALKQAGHVQADELIERLNQNLAEVGRSENIARM